MPENNKNTQANHEEQAPRNTIICFPSGLTVASARAEAERRLQQGQADTMVQALNYISTREMALRWNDALAELQKKLEHSDDSSKDDDKDKSEQVLEEELAKKNDQVTESYNHIVGMPKTLTHTKLPNSFTLSQVNALLHKYPEIGFDGYLKQGKRTKKLIKTNNEQRAQLSMAINSFTLAHDFLLSCTSIKRPNTKLTATKLAEKFSDIAVKKQLVTEDDADLIAVGAVIICALEQGYEHKQTADGICFNIGSRSAIFKV